MKTQVPRLIRHTESTLSALHGILGTTAALRDNDWVILAAITPPILAAFAVTEIGAWCIGEIGRQVRIHEKRPASPSLRGTPTPQELSADWADEPRSLATCLRLGSRLADLDPTLDHTILRTTLPNGKTVFCTRKGGMKGWLADHRVRIGYSTAMRYKKLVQRLRRVLRLDDRIPFEWLVEGLPAHQTLPADLEAPFAAAARRLAKLLRENPTLKALSLLAEKQLGIVRLVTVRKAPRHRHAGGNKMRKSKEFSVISRGRAATATPGRTEATKAAMRRLLEAGNLSGGALHLQNRIRHWLAGLAAGTMG
ncbi:MAG: hypothetical protein IKQ55_02600 [Kiritimatiellae bacterium]|nr:hypothetical protein [Kiritimatiellia bacterium]